MKTLTLIQTFLKVHEIDPCHNPGGEDIYPFTDSQLVKLVEEIDKRTEQAFKAGWEGGVQYVINSPPEPTTHYSVTKAFKDWEERK